MKTRSIKKQRRRTLRGGMDPITLGVLLTTIGGVVLGMAEALTNHNKPAPE